MIAALLIPIIFIVLFAVVSIPTFLFWLAMVIDCLQGKSRGNEKIAWILVLFFAGFIGAIIYFFVAKAKLGILGKIAIASLLAGLGLLVLLVIIFVLLLVLMPAASAAPMLI